MKHPALPVWSVSLGCPKNMVDTERLLGSLGVPIRLVPHIGRSRLVLINTCAFIESSTRESIREILQTLAHVTKLKNRPWIVVAGCLVGRYPEVREEFPEVDLWLPPESVKNWPQMLNGLIHSEPCGGRYHPGLPYAWLKISDGCDHHCTFCTIPAIRGRHRSEPMVELLEEAQALLDQGVVELDLVAQDVSAWQEGDFSLPDLLRKLAELPGLRWLRLLYLYPSAIKLSFLDSLAGIGMPFLPYFDIPFQHCAPELLRRMGRPFVLDPREVVSTIQQVFPKAALRTSLIVGFPGETEDDFVRLCDFVRETRFYNMGVFCYSAEEGTPAASFPGQVPEEEKERRRDELMKIQAGISQEILSGYRAQEMDVLVDRDLSDEWPGLCSGRVWFQAPEIDGITYISGPEVAPGKMVVGRIENTMIYDLNALA